MSWKQNVATLLADMLRLSIRACLFIDGILIALASIWLCGKCLYFSMNWLNRVCFNSPW